MRTAAWTLLCVVVACAGSERERHRSRGPTPQELSELLDDFDRAVREGQLERAGSILAELEAGIDRAPVATITHPDYMRISAAADRAAGALEAARGGASFAGWLSAARSTIEVAEHVVADLGSPPTRKQFAALERVTKRLERLVISGEGYKKESEYAAIAEQLENRLIACGELLQRLRWQVAAAQALAGPLGDAHRAEQALAGAPPAGRRSLVATMVGGFKSCAAVALVHASKVGADATPLPTPYGEMPIAKIEAMCTRRADEATGQLGVPTAETAEVPPPPPPDEAAPPPPPPPPPADDLPEPADKRVADVHADLAYAEHEIERAGDADHEAVRVVALANALVALDRCTSRAVHLQEDRGARLDAGDLRILARVAERCRRQAARVEALLGD